MPVGRDTLARTHQHEIAAVQLAGRHRLLFAVHKARGRNRQHVHQCFGDLGGALTSGQLECAAGEQEEHEHHHRVVIHLAVAGDCCPHATGKGEAQAKRHRYIHADTLLSQVPVGAAKERLRRVAEHRQGEDQAEPVKQVFEFGLDPSEGAGVQRHRQDHYLHAEGRRHRQPP